MVSNYVIVGNSAAAVGAIESIRQVDRESSLTVISQEPYACYSRPLISYLLAGKIKESNISFRERDFYADNQVDLRLGKKALRLDPEGKALGLSDGNTLTYKKLLVATGSLPLVPPVKGTGKKGQHFFYFLEDIYRIRERLREGGTAVVVGGGLIGLKAAEALSLRGQKVIVVERASHLLGSILTPGAARLLEEHLGSRGIHIITGNSVEEITGEEEVRGVILSEGQEVPCDLVILAAGVRPNLELLEGTPVPRDQGILVNARMETGVKDIYAAGDVAQGWEPVAGQQKVVPIWPSAFRQGVSAGRNMAGLSADSPGEFPRNSINLYGLNIITAGRVTARGEDQEIVFCNLDRKVYRRVIIQEGRVTGFIKIGDVDRAGTWTWLIQEKVPVDSFKDSFRQENFSLLHLPRAVRESLYREQEVF